MHKNKKATGFGHWIFTVLLILILLWWFIGFATRECRKNTDCQKDNYCDYRYTCQKIPMIEKDMDSDYISKQNAFLMVLGAAIVGGLISYYVLKNEQKIKKDETKDNEKKE